MMEQKNHEKFSSANNKLSEVLKNAYEGKHFHRNLGWAGSGLLLVLCRNLAGSGGSGRGDQRD